MGVDGWIDGGKDDDDELTGGMMGWDGGIYGYAAGLYWVLVGGDVYMDVFPE